MIGIAALVFAFAYGRMSKSFGLRPFAILAVIALLLTYLSALLLSAPIDSRLLLAALLQFALTAVLFMLGVLLGRWLDREKDSA